MEPTPNPNVNPAPANPTPENPAVPETQTPAAGSPEFQPGANQGAPPTQQSPQQQPTNQIPIAPGAPVQQSPQPQRPATPATASDDVDVIEKEWVDQAEKAIEKTKDDPHAEEEAVEDLQADYLKKRYGHDLKRSNDG